MKTMIANKYNNDMKKKEYLVANREIIDQRGVYKILKRLTCVYVKALPFGLERWIAG